MEKDKGVIQFTIHYCEDGTFDVDTLAKNLSLEALELLVQDGYVTAKFSLEMVIKASTQKGEQVQ